MIRRADWLAITKDRMAIALLLAVAIITIFIIITTVLRVHSSDIQVPVRYTAYGQSNIERDQWYTQYSYMGFAIALLVGNVFLAVKIYQINRLLSLGFLGLSIFLLVMAALIANATFNLAPAV
ncbi:MAG TPA: hypothetical protein VLA88_06230 [Candidatus Saccharimonadales bacterium]|nr:hypothetical protein [Candidatus Saccharimonadales bacterium]